MYQAVGETILCNINYIDVVKEEIVEGKNIIFNNGFITDITDYIPHKISSRLINCEGKWAIPSLIDAHAHLSFNPFNAYDVSNDYGIIWNLADASLSGVCLIRDLGISKVLCDRIFEIQRQTSFCFPEIITAGTPICVDSGHGIEFGVCISLENIDRWVENHKANGYKWIKIMNDPENHTQDYMNYLVTKSHKENILVACHVFTHNGINGAINAQVDTIEHSVPLNSLTLEQARDIYFVPTAYSAWLSTRENFLNYLSEQDAKYLLDWNDMLENNLQKAIKDNLLIVTGTDGGSAPSKLHDIINEIKLFVQYGMSEMQSIKSGTLVAACCLRREKHYGSIEVGKYANLILLNQNPLENINALDNKCSIYLRGTNILNEVVKK